MEETKVSGADEDFQMLGSEPAKIHHKDVEEVEVKKTAEESKEDKK